MPPISTIFCDVGGVLLTDGWGHESRKLAAQTFQFDWEEFEALHHPLAEPLDSGLINVSYYLDQVLFYKERSFSRDQFFEFMKEQSKPFLDRLDVMSDVASSNKYLMATINNESIDLNLFRIQKFKLADHFKLFFSSCYMRCRKPGKEIFANALHITNKQPQECVFIDDRDENLKAPRDLGMQTIQCIDGKQLRAALVQLNIESALVKAAQ
jgi:putative hydrolase of the HAD superfamily